jgi:hypothetical protein
MDPIGAGAGRPKENKLRREIPSRIGNLLEYGCARLILCALRAHLDLFSVRDGIGPGMLLKAVQVAKED